MGSLVNSAAAFLSTSLLVLLFGFSSVLAQDLRETDALCNSDGCFVVYFQRKTFLDSWRACKEKGGNLATIKQKEDATTIATLFSTVDLRHSRTKVQVWIGLQRQPRQCTTTHPLRGFSWTTGDQDTEYTNWQNEDSPSLCSMPRCVAVSYSTQVQDDNFKWLDGACVVSVDGYLCHYAYKGMCPALWSEGEGNVNYTTPFNLLSTLLTSVPFGSVATVLCPTGTKEEQTVVCMLREDGSVGWSRESPLCSHFSNLCEQDNGGCEHFCISAGGHVFCKCADGYQLGENGQSCHLSVLCQGASCEFECLPLSDGYRCACLDGYTLAPDERTCLDVDECLQSPCEQICENYEGGFECYCRKGFELMSDHSSCQKIEEGDTITPPLPWITRQAGPAWDYDWNSEQRHTGWPTQEEQSLDWLTDPPRVLNSGVIWLTSIPQEELSYDSALEPLTQDTAKDEEDIGRVDWSEGDQRSQSELNVFSSTTYTTLHPFSSTTITDWYKKDEEAATTAPPLYSTSTISEGALNWWTDLTTLSQSPGKPHHSFTDDNMPRDSSYHKESEGEKQRNLLRENIQFKEEELNKEEKDFVEITHSQNLAVPTKFTSSQPHLIEEGKSDDSLDSATKDGRQKQGSIWLIVGLFIPICIFIVVMLALGIAYCNRCAVKSHNKDATDCYHWISGAHDKQGDSNPSAGTQTHV
ncbi:endosialin-like [Archocentrus centrarchus]|uniref:endosialin-like n=1 Tax=Archocentrus centrarchus TaxID=63155 RepID=UPI0011E9F346|nr:endosialin-like [Archocentrus centrarchus]